MTVNRDGKIFEQEYQIGVPQYPGSRIGASEKTGTTVHFWPDDTIFITLVYNKDILESRLRELSSLNKGVRIILNDLREKEEDGLPIPRSFTAKAVLSSLWKCLTTTPAAVH